MTNLTKSIPASRRKTEEAYPFHLQGTERGYPLTLEPHDVRAMPAYCFALKPLAEYIDEEKQAFGLRVRATPYETELEAWVLPATEPPLSPEEEKELEIQLLGKTLINVFREIRMETESIASIIDVAIQEIGGGRHGS